MLARAFLQGQLAYVLPTALSVVAVQLIFCRGEVESGDLGGIFFLNYFGVMQRNVNSWSNFVMTSFQKLLRKTHGEIIAWRCLLSIYMLLRNLSRCEES